MFGSPEKRLRKMVRFAMVMGDTPKLMDIIFEEARRAFPEDNAATRYYHLRTELDASAKKKDLYYGKHPAIDNRAS